MIGIDLCRDKTKPIASHASLLRTIQYLRDVRCRNRTAQYAWCLGGSGDTNKSPGGSDSSSLGLNVYLD